jgi:ParB family chromosome partitioning protein
VKKAAKKKSGSPRTGGKKSAGRKNARKKNARKKTARQKTGARKRLSVSRRKRGLVADEMPIDLDSPELRELALLVRERGGALLGAYRDPLAGLPLLVAALPIEAVEPTPFQRDLSPTHTRRLAEKIEESTSFLDPIIVVKSIDGQFWTPNGRHRLAAAKVLGLKQITTLISGDEGLAFRILALNTEKAHNLKDRSLEVIRMARELASRKARVRESELSSIFEAPELLTLGLAYEDVGRFAGGAYSPFLKKVDRFSERTLAASLKERQGYASRLLRIEVEVKKIIAELQDRGFKSPYLRSYVVARINPCRFHRFKKGDDTPPMAIGAALTRMAAAARKFDTTSVRENELALVSAISLAEDS